MHVKAINVSVKEGGIILTLKAGEGSVPVPYPFDIDPATALALAGMLENAVHKVLPEDPVCFRATGSFELRQSTPTKG